MGYNPTCDVHGHTHRFVWRWYYRSPSSLSSVPRLRSTDRHSSSFRKLLFSSRRYGSSRAQFVSCSKGRKNLVQWRFALNVKLCNSTILSMQSRNVSNRQNISCFNWATCWINVAYVSTRATAQLRIEFHSPLVYKLTILRQTFQNLDIIRTPENNLIEYLLRNLNWNPDRKVEEDVKKRSRFTFAAAGFTLRTVREKTSFPERRNWMEDIPRTSQRNSSSSRWIFDSYLGAFRIHCLSFYHGGFLP